MKKLLLNRATLRTAAAFAVLGVVIALKRRKRKPAPVPWHLKTTYLKPRPAATMR